MGIEDFDVDSASHADTVLLVTASPEHGAELGAVLEKRDCRWVRAQSIEEATQLAVQTLFDLIILDERDSGSSPEPLLAAINEDGNLRRCPLLLIHPAAEDFLEGGSSKFGEHIHVLGTPIIASRLLVKASTLLRLRKLQSEQTGFESTIADQNAELRDLNNRYRKELSEARAIQRALLPKRLPTAEKTLFAAYCVPREAVGGDLYDIWQINDSRYGMFIGDVTGHGLPAAFIGAMSKMALTYAPKEHAGELLEHMNVGLSAHIPDGRFVTAALVLYDCNSGTVSLARAGHPAPYLYRAQTKEVELVEPKGLPLGVMSDAQYETWETELLPGDKLLMVTDGMTEASNMDGEMFGAEGLAEAFTSAAREERIDGCLKAVLNRLREFCGGRALKDDNTLIALERFA